MGPPVDQSAEAAVVKACQDMMLSEMSRGGADASDTSCTPALDMLAWFAMEQEVLVAEQVLIEEQELRAGALEITVPLPAMVGGWRIGSRQCAVEGQEIGTVLGGGQFNHGQIVRTVTRCGVGLHVVKIRCDFPNASSAQKSHVNRLQIKSGLCVLSHESEPQNDFANNTDNEKRCKYNEKNTG